MELLRSWITGIAVAALIVAVASVIAPKNSAGKLVGLVGSLILITAIISPIKRLDVDFVSPYIARYSMDYSNINSALAEENQKIKAVIIEDKMSAYILQRADDIGISISHIEVKAGMSEEGYLFPESAEIVLGDETSEGKRLELSEIIERECAIPYTRQKFVSERKGDVQNA